MAVSQSHPRFTYLLIADPPLTLRLTKGVYFTLDLSILHRSHMFQFLGLQRHPWYSIQNVSVTWL